MTPRERRRLLFVVNADWFFLSHRLPLARACLEHGFEVAVCAGDTGCGPAIEREGVRFYPLAIERGGTRPLKELSTVASLARTYASFRPHIVHHVTIKPVLYGSITARALRVPAVVNAVSGLGYVFIPRAEDRLHNRLLRRALWFAYRVALDGRSTRVIFQNEDDLSDFLDRSLVRRERTALIRGSGVNLARFAPRPLPDGEFTAVLPARLLWDKGVGEFVEAATRLRRRHPAARFALLGRIDPDNPAAVAREQVERWVSEGVVEWWGQVDHDAMPEAYSRASVVVLPSYREGLPLALAEAAAAGRPCIATDVPGCRDVVRHLETGWLVPARDAGALEVAIEEAMSDRARLERFGRAGAEHAREWFSVDAVVSRTLELYRAVVPPEVVP